MKPTLAVYLFGYNLEAICYPWEASLRSALALGDAVFFNSCPSPDNFHELLVTRFATEMASGKLRVFLRPWGDHHTVQAHLGNYLLDQIGDEFQFALKLDADEVLHEGSFDQFWADMEQVHKRGWHLARPRYVHFCPDDETTFPFIYDSKAVISRTAMRNRYATDRGGDACALGGYPEAQTRLVVHHYGKMHMGRRAAALSKERAFQELYTELGFPDPKVVAQWEQGADFDYLKVFDLALEAGQFQPFRGTHPIFVEDWLMERRHAEAQR